MGHTKAYIDVMQNVFGGVHITTDEDVDRSDEDFRPRPWLLGISMSAVRVRLGREDE